MLPVTGNGALGLELTDDAVKICEVRHRGRKGVRVMNFHAERLPRGVMSDGHIQDADGLEAAVAAALKARRWTTRRLHFAVPSQNVMVRMLKLPDAAPDKLKKLVQLEAKHHLHMPFDDPYCDFIKLPYRPEAAMEEAPASAPEFLFADAPEAAPPAVPMCEVMLVAASTALLESYEAMFRRLKLQPASMELKAFSLLRLQEKAAARPEGVWLMVDVGRSGCELAIIDGSFIKITRNIEARFFAEPPADTDGHAERQPADGDRYMSGSDMENAAQELASELERLINFYKYTLNNRDQVFQTVVVTGDAAGNGQLTDILAARLNLPVNAFGWTGIDVRRPRIGWDLLAFATPVGLALRGRRS